MKTKFWYGTIFTTILLVLAVKAGFAETTQQKSEASFADLRLEITAAKKEFLLLEPISLIFRLNNETNQPILGHKELTFSSRYIELLIFHNGEMKKSRLLSPTISNVFLKPIVINPGERYKLKQQLSFHMNQNFHEPGLYQIQAVLHDIDWKTETKSNLLDVRILEPKERDLQAFNYIKTINPANFFSGVGFHDLAQELSVMDDLVSNFGETVYGDYAAFALGEAYFAKEEYEKAIKYLTNPAEKKDFPFADQALSYLALANVKLHNLEKAGIYLKTLKARFPDSECIRKTDIIVSQNNRKRSD